MAFNQVQEALRPVCLLPFAGGMFVGFRHGWLHDQLNPAFSVAKCDKPVRTGREAALRSATNCDTSRPPLQHCCDIFDERSRIIRGRETDMRLLPGAALIAALVSPLLAQPQAPRSSQSANAPKLYMTPMGELFAGASRAEAAQSWIAGADSNGDKGITPIEMANDGQRFFRRLDVNADDRIDHGEMDRYEKEIAPQHLRMLAGQPPQKYAREQGSQFERAPSDNPAGRGPPPGGGGGAMGRGPEFGGPGPTPGSIGLAQPVANTDANLDGSVTAQEFAAAALRRFNSLDSDGDQLLKLDELVRSRKARR